MDWLKQKFSAAKNWVSGAADKTTEAVTAPIKDAINGSVQTAAKYGNYSVLALSIAGLGFGWLIDSDFIKGASGLGAVVSGAAAALFYFKPEILGELKVVSADSPSKSKGPEVPTKQKKQELATAAPKKSATPLLDELLSQTPDATSVHSTLSQSNKLKRA